MQVYVKVQYTLIVDSAELRLIMAGLYGGLKPDQQQAALELQRKIAEQRAAALKQMTSAAEDYVEKL